MATPSMKNELKILYIKLKTNFIFNYVMTDRITGDGRHKNKAGDKGSSLLVSASAVAR
jgi:hypothetical protein